MIFKILVYCPPALEMNYQKIQDRINTLIVHVSYSRIDGSNNDEFKDVMFDIRQLKNVSYIHEQRIERLDKQLENRTCTCSENNSGNKVHVLPPAYELTLNNSYDDNGDNNEI